MAESASCSGTGRAGEKNGGVSGQCTRDWSYPGTGLLSTRRGSAKCEGVEEKGVLPKLHRAKPPWEKMTIETCSPKHAF